VARDAIALLRDGHPGQIRYDDAPGGPLRVFVDTYPSQPTIVIFGGVHIGVALAQLAKATGGFRVVVVDARGAWATPERFASADEIHVMHADDYLKGHPLGSNSYVAVLSHDPKLDDPALIGALQSDARFVGAIGSPKTQRERRQRLAAAGISEEQLARLHGPIGLDVGAQSPEEIGVAILAQMIAAKSGKLAPAPVRAVAAAV
jgi:xanthine dehydrogenase accessory factor